MKTFLNIILITIFFFLLQVSAFSQKEKTTSLYGTITNEGKPVYGCTIIIAELNLWTTSNDKGKYHIDGILFGQEYTVETSILGMIPTEHKITPSPTDRVKLDIDLTAETYNIDEVIVLAEEKTGLGSISKIKETAIEHLQPTSLKDVLQLIPGQISSNPNLSSAAHISLREMKTDRNSSLGTAIIVDGAPISNNADLRYRTPTDMYGIDVRQISPNNITSVEVIKGIASAEHGDLTSGAVIVKTKSGNTPLIIKGMLNPKLKSAYVSKGIDLKNNHGAINIDMDYTSSIDSKTTPYEGFDRISAQLGYSNTFMHYTTPLNFNIKGKYSETLDFARTDPDLLVSKEKYESSEKGFNLNIYGKWNLNKKLITNLNYNFSINSRKQEVYQNKIVALGYIQPISNARTDTLMRGIYAPSEYYSEIWINGKPLDIFAKISADAIFTKGSIHNKLLYGFDYRSNGNNGEGYIYDELRPPRLSGGDATRPRPYSDIPFLSQYSLFVEDKVSIPVGNDLLQIQAGIRYNNFQPKGLFNSELKQKIEPRFNLKYTFITPEENKVFNHLSAFGGFGIQSKSPTLNYLYPDKAYFDLNSFNYFSSNADERLLMVSTRVVDPTNQLEPIEVKKVEVGFDGTVKGVDFMLTGYYEKSDNGLTFASHHDFTKFSKWSIDDPNIIYQKGTPPVLDLNKPTEIDTFIAQYSKPQNTKVMIKKGIEYRLDFEKIKALHTSFNINGAYMYTKNYNSMETYKLPYGNGGEQPPYVGVYAAGDGGERERFNTNVVAITHFPNLRLVFSTTLQVIWKNTYRHFFGGGQPWEYTDSNGTYQVAAPIALIDKTGKRHEISQNKILNQKYNYYISRYSRDYFRTERQPFHYQLNFKVTSEIGKRAKIAFLANNFTMYNPTYKSQRSKVISTLNSAFYFGLELKLLL